MQFNLVFQVLCGSSSKNEDKFSTHVAFIQSQSKILFGATLMILYLFRFRTITKFSDARSNISISTSISITVKFEEMTDDDDEDESDKHLELAIILNEIQNLANLVLALLIYEKSKI